MSGEHSNLQVVDPQLTDELLLVRELIGKRTTVQQLISLLSGNSSAISFSQTPPEDKALWFQLDGDGYPIDLWSLRPNGLWVSEQRHILTAFEFQVRRNLSFPHPNPFPGESLWIDSLTARAWVQDDQSRNDYIDFELSLVNDEQQQTPLFYLRLEDQVKGAIYSASEFVGQAVSVTKAMALFLNVKRNGQAKLKTCSIAVVVRRIYAPST